VQLKRFSFATILHKNMNTRIENNSQ